MPNTNYQTIHQMGSAVNNIIRQASGRDEVQNIDMDFVTVARNHCAVHEEYSGSEVSFEAQTVTPMGLIVQVNPVQDLNGYDNPWPGGGGSNIWDEQWEIGSLNTSTGQPGDSDSKIRTVNYIPVSPNTEYRIVGYALTIYEYGSDKSYIGYTTYSVGTFTTGENTYFIKWARTATTYDNNIAINYPSSVTTYSPYSNICPITGWTGANVTLSPTTDPDDPDKEVYAYTFPTEAGTVYGGTLTVNKDGTGTLMVDRASVDLGTLSWSLVSPDTANERFKGTGIIPVSKVTGSSQIAANAICSIYPITTYANVLNHASDKIAALGNDANIYVYDSSFTDSTTFASAMSGVQLVYELETPVTYTLSSLEVINTLKGTNNVFADTGDITVQFTDILEDY